MILFVFFTMPYAVHPLYGWAYHLKCDLQIKNALWLKSSGNEQFKIKL